jgi:GNAT superfamily N-acetyltransferase
MSLRIALLAGHPELLAGLAASYEREWPHWYGLRAEAASDLKERSRRSGLPICLIAMEEEQAVGALALAENAISTHPDLSPCVIGLWLEAARRRRGIGAQLLKAASAHARDAGFDGLYSATSVACGLFVREGWSKIDTGTTYGGEQVSIFALTLL